MRAVVVPEFGGPEVLEVADVPEVHAWEGHIRVRVHAAAVNPTDLLLRNGAQHAYLGDLKPPYIPGMDLAGVVDEVGLGVDTIRPGDEVMAPLSAWRPTGGAQAEFVIVPQASVVPVPEGMSLTEASTLPMNALTVYRTYAMLALPAGSTVAVFGAAGAIGGMAVEMGKAKGLRVIAVAGEKDRDTVESMGADLVVPRDDHAPQAIREQTAGGADGLIDAARVGPPVLTAVRDEGHIVSLMPFPGAAERGIKVERVFVINDLDNADALSEIRELATSKVLTARVAKTFAPDQASDAHRMLERGGVRGRPVISF
ncbi:NADP-dependent oxidoreductase [Streptomyces sp. GD-15H]|uniref:NADP-dependent oxidoreductase n=1 Tax=Streptomyces sp. GD-15H TaxID=3129112 RepID=UPI00324A5ED3